MFKPLIGTIAKAAKSSTGKAIGRALKDQAISPGTNLLADLAAGKHLKEGIDREVGNIRQYTALGIQKLANQHYESDGESEIETKKKKRRLKQKGILK